eukprot:3782518-Rhodomonas_salina.1
MGTTIPIVLRTHYEMSSTHRGSAIVLCAREQVSGTLSCHALACTARRCPVLTSVMLLRGVGPFVLLDSLSGCIKFGVYELCKQ